MTTDASITASPSAARWQSGLTAQHWRVLWGSYLGWIFDGYEAFALIVALPPALHSLLTPAQLPSAAIYAGLAIGITLLGWGIGGLVGGILADYFGRKRMMMLSILFYAGLTGLTAFSTSLAMLIAMRFLTGLAIGAEWSTGIALVAESWPDRARPKGLGFLQSGFGAGSFLAAIVWFVLSLTQPLGDETWRLIFLVGGLPAFCVFYLMRSLAESERWLVAVREKRWDAVEGEAHAAAADESRPFTLTTLFRSAEARRRVWLTFLMSLASTTGWWAVSTWTPVYAEQLAKAQGEMAGVWGPRIALVYTLGGVLAYMSSGFAADWLGRRAYLLLTFGGSLVITWMTYLWTGNLYVFAFIAFLNGVITLGFGFSWMAIYPVELFTATVRSTAASVVFNGARLIAWVFPILAGTLVAKFGGITHAALIIGSIYAIGLFVPWFLPETAGKPLPH
jgi:MFS family permease